MGILLGDLRTFARETASHDVSGDTANREVQHWINMALARIWSAHSWSHANANGRITLDVEETGDALTLVEGSRALVLVAETFEQKYLDDRWHLLIDDESNLTFELAEIKSPTSALARAQHRWVRDSDTGVGYSWARHIYPLPDDAKEITNVELAQSGARVHHLSPAKFDRVRQKAPTQQGRPVYYTVRGGNFELWPAPDDTWRTLQITYRRKPPRYTATDDDTGGDDDDTEVDWPEEWADLLYKGVIAEAALTQGKNAPVTYNLAMTDFMGRLVEYKAEDSGVVNLTGPMGRCRGTNLMQLTDGASEIGDES